MSITFRALRTFPKSVDAVVRIVTSEMVDNGIEGAKPEPLSNVGFEGKPGQFHTWPANGRIEGLVGIGSTAQVDGVALRKAGACIGRSFARQKRVGIELPEGIDIDAAAQRQALVEGVALSTYSFTTYKSEPETPLLERVDIGGGAVASHRAGIDRGALIADAQMFARDLVNEPGGSLTPEVFADRLRVMAEVKGLSIVVWDREDIAQGRLGGLLGVNRGSTNPPRLVELHYDPPGSQGSESSGPKDPATSPTQDAFPTLALVGKGVTFDAGGLSIKTAEGMMTMKRDMAGAAAVAAAMSVLGELDVQIRVRGYLPMTDNMLGGDATRPGDVLKIRNGKTIEVLNTDAEGRLILADALSLACEGEPAAVVDLATLTGACMVALGPRIAGLMGNNQALIDQVRDAADASGEMVWHLPLPQEYKEQIRSSVADLKNIGKPYGGALTAGLILQEFVTEATPWAHLDIAGPAAVDTDQDELTPGGTGFGVRLLVHLTENFALDTPQSR